MDTKLPNSYLNNGLPSAPKDRVPLPPKPARLRAFPAISPLQRCQGHCKGQPGPNCGQQGAFSGAAGPPPVGSKLGAPLDIRGVALLIGCSPWTVRQTLVGRGLPFFRSGASGKLIFYTNQVAAWIENQQGGNTTK